jgi:hypothetical protein
MIEKRRKAHTKLTPRQWKYVRNKKITIIKGVQFIEILFKEEQ